MGAEDYAEWIFGILKDDLKHEQYLDHLITPSKGEKRKAEISSVAGAMVAHFIGVGWKTTINRGTISFKEQSPIQLITVKPHDELSNYKLCFYFPVNGYITQNDFKKMQISPTKEGATNRIVSVRYDFDCTGRENICKDEELKNSLLRLFTTQRLCDISGFTRAPITVEIARPESSNARGIGKVEVGICFLNSEGVMLLFDTAAQIANIITSAVKAREVAKTQESLLPPPPPPLLSQQTASGSPHVPSQTCHRCGFRNKKGETICKRCGSQL
jgi:hypothetical protein